MSVTPMPPVAPIDELLASTYVANLTELPLCELRNRRAQCAMVESSLSYERQLVQGRLDIVGDEQRRRLEQESGDRAALVTRLPEILSLHVHAVGVRRPPTFMYPLKEDRERLARMYQVAPAVVMADLPSLSSPDLSTMLSALEEMEHEVSGLRHALHAVFDQIQREAIRRYTSGEEALRSLFEGLPAKTSAAQATTAAASDGVVTDSG